MWTIAAGVFLGLIAFAALPFVLALIKVLIEDHWRAVLTVTAIALLAFGAVVFQPSTDLFASIFAGIVLAGAMVGAVITIFSVISFLKDLRNQRH